MVPFYRGCFDIYEKEFDGPATEADIVGDRFIVRHLKEHYPADRYGYLSEETEHGPERLAHDSCWIIDPIDGTNDFIEGKEDFAVQIGLSFEGEAVLGVVYQPVPGRLYAGAKGCGAWCEDVRSGARTPMTTSPQEQLSAAALVVTRSHPGSRLSAAVAALAPARTYSAGSLGVKTMHVVDRQADLYLNTGRRVAKEWDTCAPQAILEEAGGRFTDLCGSPIRYNKADIYLHNGLVASNGPLHQATLAILSSVGEIWL
jgi:3'(2'), 5'-bisphosphate nucleotidase